MRYKVSGIEYSGAGRSIQNLLPSEVITEDINCEPAELDAMVYEYVAGFVGWAVDGARDIVPYQSPQDFAKLLMDATDHGRLVMDGRGWSIMVAAIGVAVRDGQPNALFSQLTRLLHWKPDRPHQIELYPDGQINELSFGVLWYNAIPKFAGAPFYERKDGINGRAYMQGGLIYRGPERSGQNRQALHSWTVHT